MSHPHHVAPMTRFHGMIAAVLCAAFLLTPGPATATLTALDSANPCDAAAVAAARETGVPLRVLLAVTRTETGRRVGGRLAPWPWTVNMEGQGQWFDDRAAALAFARAGETAGATRFDVGCFQINYRWHRPAFPSLEAMFDPRQNARYAAGFLARLYAEFGNWDAAVGAYHSRTPEFAARYLETYRRHYAALQPEVPSAPGGQDPPGPVATSHFATRTEATGPAPMPTQGPRTNGFPLLLAGGGPRSSGSLVPGAAGAVRPLWGTRP